MNPIDTSHPVHTNRLAQETSPYLLQHQHNPVDWYPWGDEAFDKARRENKPIFLSVGYSTCYWCHVMERQCFEVPAIAAVMNELFVSIKVDREERPDVDQLYMTAVQLITRQGGWPMSVWLMPDLRPFYGGTYFPPTDMQGRPGFTRVCRSVADAWANQPGEVAESAENIVSLLQRLGRPATTDGPVTVDAALVGNLIDRSTADYEPHFGGFGHAPKFPRQTVLELLLAYLDSPLDEKSTGARTPKDKVRKMLLHALDAMMHGGIRDHLGGAFHRYSTDAKWLVPHFEIMLYDNAMLLGVYAEAHRQTGDVRYAQVARDVADFVLREMTSPEGAFYTAMDAEVDGQEGLNYLWTKSEIEAVLGAGDAERFNRAYGVDRGPNFEDPHHGTGGPDKNILFVALPKPGSESPLLDPGLRALRQKLKDARMTRKQPLLDTKVLTSWNALMIRGLAIAGRVLGEKRYVDAGAKAADFLLTRHRMPDGRLYRTSRDSVVKTAGFLDDYAFLALALTDLAEASGDGRWRDASAALLAQVVDLFGGTADGRPGTDASGGLYFTDRFATDLIVRQRSATDSPLPSGNAAAAMAFLRHADPNAAHVVAAFAENLREQGEGMGSLVQAALQLVASGQTVAVEIRPDEADDAPRPASPAAEAAGVASAVMRRTGPREVTVTVTVRDGWHVNAADASADGLVPTTLFVSPPEDVEAIDYPPAEPLIAAYATEPLRVYVGRFDVRLRLPDAAAGRADAGDLPAVALRYQACDAVRCLPPTTVPVTLGT